MTIRAAMLATIAGSVAFAAGVAPNVLSLKIMDEVVPAGGVVQVKLVVTEPKPIVRPGFDMSFNEAMVEDVLGIALRGTTFGAVRYDHGHLTLDATSLVGAITVTPDYPVLTIALRVRRNLLPGTRIPVDLNLQGTRILNELGQPYILETKTGWITIGGTLSVANVLPGAGTIAPGRQFRLIGSGFVPGSRVKMEDGGKITIVSITPTQIVLTGSTAFQLEGERIIVETPDKQQVTYFSYLRANRTGTSAVAGLNSITPIFPFGVVLDALLSCRRPVASMALENPTGVPVTINLEARNAVSTLESIQVVLGARQTTLFAISDRFSTAASAITLVRATSTQPFRIGGVTFAPATGAFDPVTAFILRPGVF